MIVSLRCDCAFFLEKLEIIMCRLWRPECVARQYGFIKINRIDVDSMENRGRYLSKYFGKDLELKEHKKKAFFKSQNLKMPIEQKLMLTDDILQDLTQENVVFQKEYTRQVYDTKSIITNGSPLKDSSVTYLKIKKGRDCTG